MRQEEDGGVTEEGTRTLILFNHYVNVSLASYGA